MIKFMVKNLVYKINRFNFAPSEAVIASTAFFRNIWFML